MPSSPFLTHGEWVMSGLTFIYVCLTAFYALTSHKTLKALEDQGRHAKEEAEARDTQFAQQLKVSQDAATAASLNAQAVINSERAWVFADLLPTIGHARFLGEGTTSIFARINCKNVGRSPAWIFEVRVRFKFVEADKLSAIPPLEEAEEIWAGTHPIAPTDEPFSSDCTLAAEGIQGIDSITGEWAVIFGVVKYRDIYNESRQTTFGYRMLPGTDTRFTRLINYPKYNEST